MDSKVEVFLSRLPRYTISSLYLDDLFTMGSTLDNYTSALVWQTTITLQTNKEIYSQILQNDDNLIKALMEPDLLEKMPTHKLLYLM